MVLCTLDMLTCFWILMDISLALAFPYCLPYLCVFWQGSWKGWASSRMGTALSYMEVLCQLLSCQASQGTYMQNLHRVSNRFQEAHTCHDDIGARFGSKEELRIRIPPSWYYFIGCCCKFCYRSHWFLGPVPWDHSITTHVDQVHTRDMIYFYPPISHCHIPAISDYLCIVI